MGILTRALVEKAVQLALPTIREVVKVHTWGPKGVVIVVDAEGL